MAVDRLVAEDHDGEGAALRRKAHVRRAGARRDMVLLLAWIVFPIVTWALVVGLAWLVWEIV